MTETPETNVSGNTDDKPKTTPPATGRGQSHARDEARTKRRGQGVWLTHYDDATTGGVEAKDLGETMPHSSEIAALRDAVKSGKTATFVEFGQSLTDAVKAGK